MCGVAFPVSPVAVWLVHNRLLVVQIKDVLALTKSLLTLPAKFKSVSTHTLLLISSSSPLQMGETNFPTSLIFPTTTLHSSPFLKCFHPPSRTDRYNPSGFCVFHLKSPVNPGLKGFGHYIFDLGLQNQVSEERASEKQDDGF